MSVLRDALTPPNSAGTPVDLDELDYLGKYFWDWYAMHENDKIATIRFLFISQTIRVHHAKPLFTLLFGPNPYDIVPPTT